MQGTDSLGFRLDLQDSLRFAALSGDFNPLHVDPIAARRTPFGSTVVHGIHLLLRSLDVAAARGLLRNGDIATLSATFSNPVLTGDEVTLTVGQKRDALVLSGSARGRKSFSLSLVVDESRPPPLFPTPDSHAYPAESPLQVLPSAEDRSGTCTLQFGRRELAALLPSLALRDEGGWVADLLASTRVVGMRYPGLQSVYLGLNLARRQAAAGDVASLHYAPGKVDPRFGLSKVAVAGAHFEGSLEVMFRHRPIDQPSLAAITERIGATRFSGHRVLVVGGSRGLGEIAAKCAIGAGASVVITYAAGMQDAERICDEARAAGKHCEAIALDVLGPDMSCLAKGIDGAPFTHVYFFASPRIARTSPRRWDPEQFNRYQQMYIDSFARLVQAVGGEAGDHRPAFLYPSTSFIDTDEKGFAEYVVAKAAGESLCRQLSAHMGVRIHSPRLPRMLTDQTSGVAESEMADATTEMLKHVRQLHGDLPA